MSESEAQRNEVVPVTIVRCSSQDCRTRTRIRLPLGRALLPAALALAVAAGVLARSSRGHAVAADDAAQSPADVQETVLKGLEFRESQLHTLHGEAVVDSYYGAAYWPWLREQVQAVREHPGAERDRDRAIMRFDLSEVGYRIEVQSLYWGGGNMFFAGNTGRASDDISDLHLITGVTETGMLYKYSRQFGYPMAWYFPVPNTPSGFRRGRPALWLGISAAPQVPLSEDVRADIARSTDVDWKLVDHEGLSCWLLTLYRRPPEVTMFWRTRYWFAPGYDCALVRKEQIAYDPKRRTDHRYVEQWSDFDTVDGLHSAFPRRHVFWKFIYTASQPDDTLDLIWDVRFHALSVEAPTHDLLGSFSFPIGTRIMPPMSSEWRGQTLPSEYVSETSDSARIWSDTSLWAEEDWETVAPPFPKQWAECIDDATVRDILGEAE